MKKFLTMLLVVAMIFTACFASASAVVTSDEQAGLTAARAQALDEINKCYDAADYDEEGLKMIKGIIYIATYGGKVTLEKFFGGAIMGSLPGGYDYDAILGSSPYVTFDFTDDYLTEPWIDAWDLFDDLEYNSSDNLEAGEDGGVVELAKLAISLVPTAAQTAVGKTYEQYEAAEALLAATGIDEMYVNGTNNKELINAYKDVMVAAIEYEEVAVYAAKDADEVYRLFNKCLAAYNKLLSLFAEPEEVTEQEKAELVKAIRKEADDYWVNKEYNSNEIYKQYEALIEQAVAEAKAVKTAADYVAVVQKYIGWYDTEVLTEFDWGDWADYFDIYVEFDGPFFMYEADGAFDKLGNIETTDEGLIQAVQKAVDALGAYDYKDIAIYGYGDVDPSVDYAGTNWTYAPLYRAALEQYLVDHDEADLYETLCECEDEMAEDAYFTLVGGHKASDYIYNWDDKSNAAIDACANAIVMEYVNAYTALGQYKNYFLNNYEFPYLGVNIYSGYGLASEGAFGATGYIFSTVGLATAFYNPGAYQENVYDALELQNLYALRAAAVASIQAATTTAAVDAAYGQYCAAVNALNTKGEKAFTTAQAQFERKLETAYSLALKAIDGDDEYAYDYDAKLFLDRYVKDIKAVYAATQNPALGLETIQLVADNPLLSYDCVTAAQVFEWVLANGTYPYYEYAPILAGYVQSGIAATHTESTTLDLTGTADPTVYNHIVNKGMYYPITNDDVDMSVKTAATANGVMACTYYEELMDAAGDASTWTSFFTLYDTYKAQLATIPTANELVYKYLEAEYKAALEAAKTPELTAEYAVKYGNLVEAYEKVEAAFYNYSGAATVTNFVSNGYDTEFKAIRKAYARLLWEQANPDYELRYYNADVNNYLDFAFSLDEVGYEYDYAGQKQIATVIAETSAAIKAAATSDAAGAAAKAGIEKLKAIPLTAVNYYSKDEAAYINQYKQDMARYFKKFYDADFTSNATTVVGVVKDYLAFSAPFLIDVEAVKASVEGLKLTVKSTLTKGKSINLTWTVKGNTEYVEGYEIWRSTKLNSGYSKFFTQVAGKKTYKNTKSLVAGTRYYYKVRAIAMVDGTKVKSDWSNKAYRIFK